MEPLKKTKPGKTPIYPPIYWGVLNDSGLESILLVLIERDPNIQSKLYPLKHINDRQKKTQCKELAKTLFINLPEINIHLGNPDGLEHYASSIMMRLRRWTDSFLRVILTMPRSSNWPDRESVKLLCPTFARLAPLLWKYLKTRRTIIKLDVSIAIQRTQLQFCSAITIYDPQRAAAQMAAQDAVLRQLQDPYKRPHYFSNTDAITGFNKLSRYNLPLKVLTTLLPREILSVTDPYASKSGEHEPRTPTQNPVSDTAVSSAQQTPQHREKQARSGALQPSEYRKATQQITTGKMGKKPKPLDKPQLREMEPLFDETEPEANSVHELGRKLMELKGKTTELERIIMKLVREKRRGCPSEQDQGDEAIEVHLAKKQRRNECFEESNTQTLEKVRPSSSAPGFCEASSYLNSDREYTQNTPTDATPPQIHDNFLTSADFCQAEKRKRVRPWHSPPRRRHRSAPSLEKISYVSSSKLFLKEAALLERQGLHRVPPPASPPPHEDDRHEPVRNSPTATSTQAHTNDKALGSTHSPRSIEKQEEDVSEVRSWHKLDEARLSNWR